jgi:carbonyl reductase 1
MLRDRSLTRGIHFFRPLSAFSRCLAFAAGIVTVQNENEQNETKYDMHAHRQIGWGHSLHDTINTNYFGPRRVNEAFGKFLQRPGGRIVNVASASGPNYVSSLPASSSSVKERLARPWTIPGGIAELDELARALSKSGGDDDHGGQDSNGYGASKALLNAYTYLLAKIETSDLIVNSVTPGFIRTDLTAGLASTATNPPSLGAVPPVYLMMDETAVPHQPTGRYYGSDCKRSPIAFYRGPGEPEYDNDDDLVELPESASKLPSVFL